MYHIYLLLYITICHIKCKNKIQSSTIVREQRNSITISINIIIIYFLNLWRYYLSY